METVWLKMEDWNVGTLLILILFPPNHFYVLTEYREHPTRTSTSIQAGSQGGVWRLHPPPTEMVNLKKFIRTFCILILLK